MTVDGALTADARLLRARGLLRQHGQRLTAPRVAVLEALCADPGHQTADEVHARVAGDHADVALSTVYRTLESLCRLGLVQHVHVAEGPVRYHLSQEVLGGHGHAHAQCTTCGRVLDLPMDVLGDVTDRLAKTWGFHLDAGHVALSGTCDACAGSGSGSGRRAASPPGRPSPR